MFGKIDELFKKENVLSHKNQGITVARVADSVAGIELAKEVLYTITDRRTVLYLSGGSTPKALYKKLAKEEIIYPGAAGQVDERFGPPFHLTSNQLMMRESGILRYFEILDIPYYAILGGKERRLTADEYDQKFRELNAVYPKSIAIMGIGDDGHTSGIAPNRENFKNPIFNESRKNLLVSEFDDSNGPFKERVTTTFLGLEMYDMMIVMVFGSSKQNALDLMFSDGLETEIPARFYKREYISKKTLLITDQKV